MPKSTSPIVVHCACCVCARALACEKCVGVRSCTPCDRQRTVLGAPKGVRCQRTPPLLVCIVQCVHARANVRMCVRVRSCIALPSKNSFGGARGREVFKNTAPRLHAAMYVCRDMCVRGSWGKRVGGRQGKTEVKRVVGETEDAP